MLLAGPWCLCLYTTTIELASSRSLSLGLLNADPLPNKYTYAQACLVYRYRRSLARSLNNTNQFFNIYCTCSNTEQRCQTRARRQR